MSLPSIAHISTQGLNEEQLNDLLYQAIKTDLALAYTWLSTRAPREHHSEDPSSELASQIRRIFASDALRAVVIEKIFAGRQVFFANCCDIIIDPQGMSAAQFQFLTQNGALNRVDC